jgi:hypothetical protein
MFPYGSLGIKIALETPRKLGKGVKMNRKKEIFCGIAWGVAFGLLLSVLIFSNAWSAEVTGDDGEIDISISADTVRIDVEKNGEVKSVTVEKENIVKTSTGLTVDDEILIENGRIYIDGVELTEQELERLSVDSEKRQPAVGINFGQHNKRVVKRERIATVYTDTDGDLVKFGDLFVDYDQRVSGDVVSIGGDITVSGEVNGDVVSVFGDVFLKDDARVRGDVVAPFGKIHKDDDVSVSGDQVTKREIEVRTNTASFGMGARFNRVEGLTLAPTLKYESESGEYPTLELEAAYAFTLKRWEYDVGIDHKFGRLWGPHFFGSMYRLAETSDHWLLPTPQENSLAAVFFKEDFFDFYWKRGFTGGGGLWYDDFLTLDASYTNARIETLEKTAEKALFGGKKKFRENWSTILPDSISILAMEGDLEEMLIKAAYDTRDEKNEENDPTTGILASIAYAQTVDSDSADFDYSAVDGEFKWYYPVSTDQTLALRLRGGHSDDDLPLFRRYFLGGIGSLRGYEYKEFQGNRYVLLNVDYIWRFYRSDFGAGLFFDTGKAGFDESGFEDAEFKSDIGLCFTFSDFLRINLAQRLDDIDKSPVVSARMRFLL